MNFYNPFSNLPDDFTPSKDSEYNESIAGWHFTREKESFDIIKNKDPLLDGYANPYISVAQRWRGDQWSDIGELCAIVTRKR